MPHVAMPDSAPHKRMRHQVMTVVLAVMRKADSKTMMGTKKEATVRSAR